MSRHNPPHPNYPCVWLIGPLPKKKFVWNVLGNT
jgi:hypothetical protein